MQLENLNIEQQEVLITPEQIKASLPVSDEIREAVNAYRDTVRDIVDRKDPRLVVVVGPCSIHDTDAALDYAERLRGLYKGFLPTYMRLAPWQMIFFVCFEQISLAVTGHTFPTK